MKSLMNRLAPYLARFDALAPRERALVALLILVATGMLFHLLLVEPQMQKAERLKAQIDQARQQIRASEQQISLLQKRLTQDPDAPNRQLLSRLQAQKRQIDAQLQAKTGGLISPAQMPRVLETVLSRNTALKLERLNNLPVRPLLEEEAAKTGESAGTSGSAAGVYRHGLQLVFRGSYLQMLDYLEALKAVPWNFYWDDLEVTMQRYPQAQIVITVHTLGFTPGWIGVGDA